MRFRRDNDDGGFGMGGMGGSFGTSGYDPHSIWEGSTGTRGVMREDSRVPREHEDEHDFGGRGYHAYGAPPQLHREHGGFSNYAGGGDRDRSISGQHPNDHFSENEARAQEQHGYGQSQYPNDDLVMRGPHYGKGPKGYKRSDERVREEVCELMSRQGYIDASDVEVTVESGVVRLVGTVASRPEKRGLEQIADRVHGVDEVRNELRLRKHEVTTGNTIGAANTTPTSQRAPASQNGKSAHS